MSIYYFVRRRLNECNYMLLRATDKVFNIAVVTRTSPFNTNREIGHAVRVP